jgi:hypothetical protein
MILKPGDLVFVWGTDFIPRVIEEITHGPSHVAIYIGNGKLVEAQGFTTVRIIDLSYYDSCVTKVIRFEDLAADKGVLWLLDEELGHEYDYWDIFVLFVQCAFCITIPWHEGKRIICSRLARDFLFRCGLPVPDKNMTPKDMLIWSLLNAGKIVE